MQSWIEDHRISKLQKKALLTVIKPFLLALCTIPVVALAMLLLITLFSDVIYSTTSLFPESK